jgi:hypothetical protein
MQRPRMRHASVTRPNRAVHPESPEATIARWAKVLSLGHVLILRYGEGTANQRKISTAAAPLQVVPHYCVEGVTGACSVVVVRTQMPSAPTDGVRR